MTTTAPSPRPVDRPRSLPRRLTGRVAVAAGQLAAVSVIVFALTTVLPGDTAEVVLGQQSTPEQVAALRAQLGLDRPVVLRFADWAGGVLTGDPGRSLVTGVPVADELAGRLASTATVAGSALAVLVPVALAAGVTAGRRPGSVTDRVITALATAGQAIPEFASGLVLVAVFAVGLGWLPATAGGGSFTGPAVLVLPVVVLALNQVGRLARQIRVGVVETDRAEYVVHLRRLGMAERTLLWRHVLPGAVPPTVQQLARVVDGLLGGVVVVEALFALPGVGAGFVDAVEGRDLPLVQGYALLFATTTVLVNLAADLVSDRLAPHREALA
ncbi:ABC transporter permease [Actinomycetospora sp.]|uniref:ABC transporter permease n=1 Tax=Actinomycetospora sp. TaxID=1872135 RepID=UPI002F414863